ncbi:heparan-alpha-glucosaminide N-acetyltransferase domain-containing protein [Georgenia daeguensis]|uniref:Heparan-alpha-glucosaminide N-acetyltransferase domain-containing protein n=1 Tax=Georgenia daeguensis TaxID=908355 RepID=A0ABP8EU05_9MICO
MTAPQPHGLPVAGAAPAVAAARPRGPRLVGIDVARGLAVLGMFVAHLGDDGPDGRHDPAWFVVADGRSAALFALLAGVSLALANGRQVPPAGLTLIRARLATLVRAGVLLVIGVVLVLLGTPVLVILPAYAAMFVLALPFLGADRRVLLLGAVAAAVVSPTVIFLLTTPLQAGGLSVAARLTGLDDPVELPMDVFATGAYPALVFLTYILLGMIVGRSHLSSTRVQLALLGSGTVLAAAAWGTSRVVLDALGDDAPPLALRLASAGAHEYSTLEVVGNCGTSLAVIGLCLLLTGPASAAGRAGAGVLSPVAATGATSLSVYSFHIVAIFLLGNDVVWYPESNAVLLWFVAIALAAAWLWRRFLGRGPLERLVRSAVAAVLGPPPPR